LDGGELTMCLICVELKKDNLTSFEARRNLGEMKAVIDDDHRLEILRRIWDKEDEEYDSMIDYGSD
jgi:hypothetical protein